MESGVPSCGGGGGAQGRPVRSSSRDTVADVLRSAAWRHQQRAGADASGFGAGGEQHHSSSDQTSFGLRVSPRERGPQQHPRASGCSVTRGPQVGASRLPTDGARSPQCASPTKRPRSDRRRLGRTVEGRWRGFWYPVLQSSFISQLDMPSPLRPHLQGHSVPAKTPVPILLSLGLFRGHTSEGKGWSQLGLWLRSAGLPCSGHLTPSPAPRLRRQRAFQHSHLHPPLPAQRQVGGAQ